MNRELPTWFEFFAGGGMARLGLDNRWKCVFANDWCEKKARAYRAFFGSTGELLVKDVAKLTAPELPGHPALVWASFPCQDLSLAGEGAGLNGKRSGTFAPFWNLIRVLCKEKRKPALVVLENVVGAVTSHDGKDFSEIFRKVSLEGYRVGPLVLDAVRFLPQTCPKMTLCGGIASG